MEMMWDYSVGLVQHQELTKKNHSYMCKVLNFMV